VSEDLRDIVIKNKPNVKIPLTVGDQQNKEGKTFNDIGKQVFKCLIESDLHDNCDVGII
jgi:hypothetical protein